MELLVDRNGHIGCEIPARRLFGHLPVPAHADENAACYLDVFLLTTGSHAFLDLRSHRGNVIRRQPVEQDAVAELAGEVERPRAQRDRKSTRLNSSHTVISYAVFCLKKK